MTPAELPFRDIHLPPVPGWWPPAPGWWALAAVALITVAAAIWWRRRAGRRRSAVAQARLELQRLRGADSTWPASRTAAELSALLRRVSISLFPRARTAGLTGDDWLAFLDDVQGGSNFRHGPGQLLVRSPYRPGVSAAEVHPLLDLSAAWIDAAQVRARREAS